MNLEEIRLTIEKNWGECCVATGSTEYEILGAKAYVNLLTRRAGGHANCVLRARANLNEYGEIIDRANSIFSKNRLSYKFYESPASRDKSIGELLSSKGFSKTGDQTFMIYIGGEVQRQRPGVSVKTVDESSVNFYADIIYTSFGWPLETKEGFAESMRTAVRDERVIPFMAYIEDRPVGALLFFSTGGTGSIYQVGTHPSYRNRGVAASLLMTAIEESKKRGDTLIWLRTTRDYAEQVYKKLGLTVAYRGLSYRLKTSK